MARQGATNGPAARHSYPEMAQARAILLITLHIIVSSNGNYQKWHDGWVMFHVEHEANTPLEMGQIRV